MKSLYITRSIATAVLAASSALFPLAARTQAATIASAYSGGAGSYTLTGTVTSILNTSTASAHTFTFADGTGSILAYNIAGATYSPTVGDNITVTATNSPYQGGPELVNTGFTETTNSTGNATGPMMLTVTQFNSAGNGTSSVAPYAEALVTLSNVTLPAGTTTLATNTNYAITDGTATTTLYGYKSDSAVLAAVNAANAMETSSPAFYSGPLNITGYVDGFNGTSEIYPVAITAAVPEPSAYALTGLGGLGLMLCMRRARQNRIV